MTTNINNEPLLFPEQTRSKEASEAETNAGDNKAKSNEKPGAAMADDQEAAWKKAIDEFNNTKDLQPYMRHNKKMELLGQMKTGLEVYNNNGYSAEKIAEVLVAKFKGHLVLANVTGRNVRDLLNPKKKNTNSKKTGLKTSKQISDQL